MAETDTMVYMVEPKRRSEMTDPEVVAKMDVAVKWCEQASDNAKTYQGKPWKYLLIPNEPLRDF